MLPLLQVFDINMLMLGQIQLYVLYENPLFPDHSAG